MLATEYCRNHNSSTNKRRTSYHFIVFTHGCAFFCRPVEAQGQPRKMTWKEDRKGRLLEKYIMTYLPSFYVIYLTGPTIYELALLAASASDRSTDMSIYIKCHLYSQYSGHPIKTVPNLTIFLTQQKSTLWTRCLTTPGAIIFNNLYPCTALYHLRPWAQGEVSSLPTRATVKSMARCLCERPLHSNKGQPKKRHGTRRL